MTLHNWTLGNWSPFRMVRPGGVLKRNADASTSAGTSRSSKDVLHSDLHSTVGDGLTASVMVGMGETYLPAFVLALGMGEIASGMITTVPLLVGAVLQLITPWAVTKLQSRRRWVVGCARGQALSLLLLATIPAMDSRYSWLVFVGASLYWGTGMASSPVWNTWMEELIPKQIRPRFFARRVKICQATVMCGFVIGGIVLDRCAGTTVTAWAFAALFASSAAFRFASSCYLARQSEPQQVETNGTRMDVWASLRQIGASGNAGLLLYLVVVQAAVYTSGPYFAPFMLKKLHLSYIDFMTLVALGYLGKVLALSAWGRFAARYGMRRLLWAGAIGIIPISAMWLVSQSFWYLVCVQLLAGILWAGYELAMAMVLLEAIPRQHRVVLLTLYNVGNAAAMVVGGLFGAALLGYLGRSTSIYLMLFGWSSLARLAALAVLIWTRKSESGRVALPARVTSVAGSTLRPVFLRIEARVLATLRLRFLDMRAFAFGVSRYEGARKPAIATGGRDAKSGTERLLV
jgi:MFS family permease